MNKPQSNLEYSAGYGENYANLRKKEYNDKKDYTVRELSAELNIAASTISQIEKEKREPTVEQVMIYKKFFGVSLDFLVGDTKVLKADVKTICEYTGLNEEAVYKLHFYNNGEGADILNSLMEHLPATCGIIHDYKKAISDTVEKIRELKSEQHEAWMSDDKEKMKELMTQTDKLIEIMGFYNWKYKKYIEDMLIKALEQ